MNYKELIIRSGIRMLQECYTLETWGNISCREPGTDRVYITPSAMDYHTIQESDIVVSSLDGTILEGFRKPSIEFALHLAVYNARPEVNAVVHTHPLYSTVFSCMGEDIPLIIDEAAQTLGGTIRTARYALPGSGQLAQECIQALGNDANACLLASHGAVCVGANMDAAFKVAKVLEVSAQIYQMIRACGGHFIPISEENIAAMQDFAKHHYKQPIA